ICDIKAFSLWPACLMAYSLEHFRFHPKRGRKPPRRSQIGLPLPARPTEARWLQRLLTGGRFISPLIQAPLGRRAARLLRTGHQSPLPQTEANWSQSSEGYQTGAEFTLRQIRERPGDRMTRPTSEVIPPGGVRWHLRRTEANWWLPPEHMPPPAFRRADPSTPRWIREPP